MTTKLANLQARDRIIHKAVTLFYRQGYNATGINQIISESGVAKATFYAHFPSKDDLCLSYLRHTSEAERALVAAEIKRRRTALGKYLAPIEVLEPWLVETDFRGCPFLNLAPEIEDYRSPLRKVGEDFYRDQHKLIAKLVQELQAENSKRYGKLDPNETARRYMTILVGVIGLCEIQHSLEPLRIGTEMVKGLLG